GLTVAEAMACERPVVVSNRGSLPEVVSAGEGGFLCEPDDAGGFARAVLELLGDERLRQKFGVANRARVAQLFRWERAAAQVTRVYEEVLDGWRRRPQARWRRGGLQALRGVRGHAASPGAVPPPVPWELPVPQVRATDQALGTVRGAVGSGLGVDRGCARGSPRPDDRGYHGGMGGGRRQRDAVSAQ